MVSDEFGGGLAAAGTPSPSEQGVEVRIGKNLMGAPEVREVDGNLGLHLRYE